MNCRILILPVVTAVVTAAAPAEVLPIDYEGPASMTVSGGLPARLGRFSSDKTRTELLTHQGLLPDADKDGFLDVRTGDVNPTGYVVMHFARREHNVRVGLGGLLGADIAVYASPIRTGAPKAGEPAVRWEELDSDLRPYEDDPAAPNTPFEPGSNAPNPPGSLPEPAGLMMFGVGAMLVLKRR